MTDKLIVITSGPDGVRIQEMTEAKFLKRMADGEWGTVSWMQRMPEFYDGQFQGTGTDSDTTVGVVIRGKVVAPRPKRVVEEWELP